MKELTRKDALLKLIMDLGGEGTRPEINERIPEYWTLREDDKEIEPIPQKPYYWHRADSYRQQLKDRYGFLNLINGIWKVTPEGKEYLVKQGLYKEDEKTRLSKEEGKYRQKAIMKLLHENEKEISFEGKDFINKKYPEYYPVSPFEYELDQDGYPKYYKTVAGVLSYLKTQGKADNVKQGVWILTPKGKKDLNPPLPEKEFYEPFRKWFDKTFDCNSEICASNKRGGNYENPDIFAQKENMDIMIEIKSSDRPHDVLKGLMQAMCYKFISHLSYLVFPATVDEFRLYKLAESSGVGLIEFDNTSSSNPKFKVLLKARKDNYNEE